MRNFIFLAVTLMLTTGCNPIKGIFIVEQDFTVAVQEEVKDPYCRRPPRFGPPKRRRPGSPDCNLGTEKKDIRLQQGSYAAELNFNSKSEISLEFESQDEKDIDIEMKIPKSVKIPQNFGEFTLTAAEMKQSFDLAGTVDTKYSRSDVYDTSESCTYTTTEYICKRVRPKGCEKRKKKKDRDGACRPRRVCKNEIVVHYGRQDVEYHYEYETKNVELELMSPNTAESLAHFSGSLTESNKVYDYVGSCF